MTNSNKDYCDICGKQGLITEKKDYNSGNYYNICDSTKCKETESEESND